MTNLGRSMLICYVSVWVACLFVAVTDEFHQTFVASRSASVRDILIDSGGAILGLLISAGLGMGRSTRLNENKSSCKCVTMI
jgi:VanZ family protein